MKKILSGILAVSVAASTAGVLSVYAEDAQALGGIMYATNMNILQTVGNNQQAGGIGSLASLDSNGQIKGDGAVGNDSAAFFDTASLKVGEDYIEADIPQVSQVEGLRFRSRGCIQQIQNSRIMYLDNSDGLWKTAVADAACSEYHDSYDLFWKEVTFSETVTTAKIRVYPLSQNGTIRLDGLQVLGTATEDMMIGNQLYGASVTLDSKDYWMDDWAGAATIDGKYKHENANVIQFGADERKADVIYNLPEEKTIDYVDITTYYAGHAFQNGFVSVWDEKSQSWEKVGNFEKQSDLTAVTFSQQHAELKRPVTTNRLKITLDDSPAVGGLFSLSEVYAGAAEHTKLDNLYFTTYEMEEPNPDACSAELGRLHEDGNQDKQPGDAGYGDPYDAVFFFNAQKAAQPAGDEDYIEMMFYVPADVKEIVLKTVEPNRDDKYVFSKPTSASIYYLDHKTGEWTYDGCLSIPLDEYVSTYYFNKAVYADAVRVYVTGIEEPCQRFRIAGLYASGNVHKDIAKDENIHHGGNVLDGANIVNNGVYFGELIDGNYGTQKGLNVAADSSLWINPAKTAEINQIEIIYPYALTTAKVTVHLCYPGGIWENNIVESTFDYSGESLGNRLNPARQIITLPKTYTAAVGQTWRIRFDNLTGSLNLKEIIFRNAENTGYTISDAEITRNGNIYTINTHAENYENVTKSYDVFYAAYQAGKLIGVQKCELNLKPFSKRTRSAAFDFSGLTGEVQLKRYIWTGEMNPYTTKTDVQTIQLSEN